MKNPKPLISQKSILDLLQRMESSISRFYDSRILAALLRLAYYGGLKRGELLNLKVGDLLMSRGKAPESIKTNRGDIQLPPQEMQILKAYFQYLKKEGYQISPASPLFPAPIKKTIKKAGKGGTGNYYARKLQRDLKTAVPEIKDKRILEHLRQAGICDYHARISQNLDPKTSLIRTMEFAGCKTGKYIGWLLASSRRNVAIGPLPPKPSKLENLIKELSQPFMPEGERAKKADRLFKALDKDKKMDPAQRQSIKMAAENVLARFGINIKAPSTHS
jgi:hypothetical protein